MPFPRELLGYRNPASQIDSRTKLLPNTIRQADIPPDFLDASAAHICPLDYLTHTLLPAVLRQAEFTTVTLDPSPGYMNPTYWNEVPALLTGLTAFLPSEEELCSLFQGKSDDLWEMAEAIAGVRLRDGSDQARRGRASWCMTAHGGRAGGAGLSGARG